MEKRIEEAYANISCLTDEVGELKEQLHAAQEQAIEAEKAKDDAEERRDKAEAQFTNYSSIVQSGNELDKAQLEGALARVAQLEFDIDGMRDRVREANARRAEDAARFNSLLQEFMGQPGKALSRKPRATKSPAEET